MKKRALIAMSGGVDSSAAALLMLNKGYECIGATMELCENCETKEAEGACEDDTACAGKGYESDNVRAAADICKRLGMEHIILDYREAFKKNVIDDFVSEYMKGHTPNPCIVCNRTMKFGLLYDKAKELGCDVLVTGHYVRKAYDAASGKHMLKKAKDASKDQSYFLYFFNQDLLSHLEFPLGEYTKEEIRKLAADNGFVNADKKDSQDICFVPDGDYKKVIEKYAGNEEMKKNGNFVDLKGNIFGSHKGIYNYTIGQRKGLGISHTEPLYVLRLDTAGNEVILGRNEDLFKRNVHAECMSFINYPEASEDILRTEGIYVSAKLRYRHREAEGVLKLNEDGSADMIFDEPQRAVTSGQSLVIYDKDTVLGGGIIYEKRSE